NAQTSLPSPTSEVAAAGVSDRSRYAETSTAELIAMSKELLHQPVQASGAVFLVRLVASGEHVQIQTGPNDFVWAFFSDRPALAKGQKITVYGTSAGLITVPGADGKRHQQPLIEPVDFFDSK
ncbi:MAG: hypothetical protein ACYDAG_06150, partial [Chloroflexota bacterium]